MSAGLCDHCHLPLPVRPRAQRIDGRDQRFCCYGCALAFQAGHGHREEPETAWLLIRLGIGGFLAMNIMLFSLLLYSGGADGALRQGVHVLLALLATPVMLFLGGPFARGAWADLRRRRVSGDTLITLGAGSAYGLSLHAVATGGAHVWFDTATMVLVLFTVGRYLEAAGRARTACDLAPMLAAERGRAHRLVDGSEVEAAAMDLAVGDRVVVYPGERVPVDGVVEAGTSACDESVVTGQAEPRAKRPGATVHAGGRNGEGTLHVRATVAGTESRWMRVGRLVREGLARKGRLAQRLDRVAAVFVPLVLVLAAGTFAYWSGRGPVEEAVMAALSVLVVACPCALGLAAPLATALGTGAAARRGAVVRGGAVLERLAAVRGVALDKTGTVTGGRPRLNTVLSRGEEGEVWARAVPLAAASRHPLARAIAGAGAGLRLPEVEDLRTYPGEGTVGSIDGRPAALGSARLMQRLGWRVPDGLAVPGAETPVYCGWDGAVHGVFGLVDPPLPEAVAAVAALHRRGLKTLLLSGDGPAPTEQAARRLGVGAWRGGLMPEEKVRLLEAWQDVYGPAVMVGDGLNDGPVLARAAVGVAVGGAVDLARESADLVLPDGGWPRLPELFALARRVRRVIYGNLAWALGYNLVALALAAAGLLVPVAAAALMAGSSLLVVLHSRRAGRLPEAEDPAGAVNRTAALRYAPATPAAPAAPGPRAPRGRSHGRPAGYAR